MIEHDAKQFLALWKRWDTPPHDGAVVFCDAEIELGGLLGLSHMEVHRRLTASRRSGASYRESYDSLLEEFQ